MTALIRYDAARKAKISNHAESQTFELVGGRLKHCGLCLAIYRRTEPSWFRPWMLDSLLEMAETNVRAGLRCAEATSAGSFDHGGLIREGFDYVWTARRAPAS